TRGRKCWENRFLDAFDHRLRESISRIERRPQRRTGALDFRGVPFGAEVTNAFESIHESAFASTRPLVRRGIDASGPCVEDILDDVEGVEHPSHEIEVVI